MPSTRRTFLATAAAASGAMWLPGCSAAAGRPRRAPGEPARLMFVGVGGRGMENLEALSDQNVAVLCDVDRARLAEAGARFPAARQVSDYRDVLRASDASAQLDGVVVSTPDHSHFLPAALALRQGLDVYCEKPLTHTVAEARELTRLAAANGCVTQMGIQIHASDNFRRVVEAVRAGAIGAVAEVVVFVNGTDWSTGTLPRLAPVPDTLDWDLWLGPAQPRAFAPDYHPMGWRKFWAFGGGTTADMACHYLDLACWALELGAPVALRAEGSEPHAECAPRALRCTFEFERGEHAGVLREDAAHRGLPPGRIALTWHAGQDRPAETLAKLGLERWRNGVLFVGERGWLVSDYNVHRLGPEPLAREWKPPQPSLPASPGHHREWLVACAERTQPSTSFAYAGPLTELALLANVAFRGARGKRLTWYANELRTDDVAANALLAVPARDGFRV
jgi:predicted dehydrogenase